MRLVVRPAGSTLAIPKDAAAALTKGEEIPWHFAADVMDFARVMRGTSEYMLEQYDDEIRQIEQLERHDELMFGDDTEWTQKAIRSCQVRCDLWLRFIAARRVVKHHCVCIANE